MLTLELGGYMKFETLGPMKSLQTGVQRHVAAQKEVELWIILATLKSETMYTTLKFLSFERLLLVL